MFSDIVDSSKLAHSLDPEDWREILSDYYDEINDAVTKFGGTIAKFVGDGVVAYFGWPEAHDNDAERAVRAALTIVGSAKQHGRDLRGRYRSQIEVRIGIHRGDVVIDRDGEIYGEAPNVAARIQAEAAPNTVIVSEQVEREISKSFETSSLGQPPLRGIPTPHTLFRVRGFVAGRRQIPAFTSGFVGREGPLAQLQQHWAAAKRGRGWSITLSGEGGIGKSRLMQEFRRRLQQTGERHVWLQAPCSPFLQTTAFAPVAAIFARTIGRRSETTEAAFSLLSDLLQRSGGKAKSVLPLIADMLGLTSSLKVFQLDESNSEVRRTKLLEALSAWVFRAAARRPTIILLEDAHWADPSTLELADRIERQCADSALLLLRTTRQDPPALQGAGTRIVLDRLDDSDVRKLVASTDQSRGMPAAAIDTIVARANGVPLFVEELTLLVASSEGHLRESDIPSTLAGSLNARLDQLGPARELAQLAAVVGHRFFVPLVRSLTGWKEDEFARSMKRLADSRILNQSGFAGQAFCGFRHALVRDAAYESLLKTRRRDLHRQVAELLSSRFSELAAQQPELLARHWSDGEEHAKAADAWGAVAQAAMDRSAHEEARKAYEQALACLQSVEETPARDLKELVLRNAALQSFQVTRGYSAAATLETAERSRELAQKLADDTQLMSQTYAEWAALSSAGRFSQASPVADRFLELANAEGSPYTFANACMIQMTSRYRRGDLMGALAFFEKGKAAFEDERFARGPGAIAQTFGNAGRILWMAGKADEAQLLSNRAIKMAEDRNNAYDLAFAEYMAAILLILLRQPARAGELAEHSIELSERHKFPQFIAISRVVLGRALAALGRSSEGIRLIDAGITGMKETRATVAMTMYLGWLSEAHSLAAERPIALQTIEDALRFNPDEGFFRPELFRIRGELRAVTNRMDLAELDLRRAVQSSVEMGAIGLQLRAALALHRLLRLQNRTGNARELADILQRLGSKHETLDTSEARDIVAAAA